MNKPEKNVRLPTYIALDEIENNQMTLDQLQKIQYKVSSSFELMTQSACIQCDDLIRVVPGKRLVLLGSYSLADAINESSPSAQPGCKQRVIVKLFVHPCRAKKHWLRELAGAELLHKHQILTPELIASGQTDEGVYFLIFRYIKGQNLALFWAENSQSKRQKQLKLMMSVLARHHHVGLAHQDLHYANFLLADDGQVYTLDGEEVKNYSAPLAKKIRLNNLALFLAQTFDLSRDSCISLLNDYLSMVSLTLEQSQINQFWKAIKVYQQGRIDQYLKKILRECTDVIYHKKNKTYTLCRREYAASGMQKLLHDPDAFFQADDAVFLKQGNTCTVKSIWLDDKQYVIKRYNPKGALYELRHKGQISRARKSWINAHLLSFMGILTPAPVALIEQTPSLGERCSYFICQFQAGQSSWDFFCDTKHPQSHKQQVADELIMLLEHLCEYKITHGDLKGSNFLIHNRQAWVLDLDALTQHKTNWRFKKSWQRDKMRFLKNWDKKACYEPWKRYFNQKFQ